MPKTIRELPPMSADELRAYLSKCSNSSQPFFEIFAYRENVAPQAPMTEAQAKAIAAKLRILANELR